MKVTRANVEEYAVIEGLEPLQVDGIPEGFVFKEADITISKQNHKGRYILFFPLRDWKDIVFVENTGNEQDLLKTYNNLKDGKRN